MPLIYDRYSRLPIAYEEVEIATRHSSKRKVRKIVTPSGKGVRGNFPSRKAPVRLQFESRVEEAALRVLEVSTLTEVIQTQPCVIDLPGITKPLRYTPDVEFICRGKCWLLEVKVDRFRRNPATVERLREVLHRMRTKGMSLCFLLESEIRANKLQEELTLLLRERPAPGRYRDDLDHSQWDPLDRHKPTPELLYRWREAQRVCDDLLTRVMSRDAGDLLAEAH